MPSSCFWQGKVIGTALLLYKNSGAGHVLRDLNQQHILPPHLEAGSWNGFIVWCSCSPCAALQSPLRVSLDLLPFTQGCEAQLIHAAMGVLEVPAVPQWHMGKRKKKSLTAGILFDCKPTTNFVSSPRFSLLALNSVLAG